MAALVVLSVCLLYLTYIADHLPESRSDCEEYGRMFDVRGFELVSKAIHPNSSEIIEITTSCMFTILEEYIFRYRKSNIYRIFGSENFRIIGI